MKKLLKILFFLFLLCAVGVGIFLWNLNPILSTFKPNIEQLISDAVHRPVTIGQLSFRIFPTLAVTVSDVVLVGEKDSTATTARVKSLVLTTKLGPLLHKELQVTEIGIDGAEIGVSRAADGTIEVSGLPLGGKKTADDAEAPKANGDAVQERAVDLQVNNAWVKDSKLSFIDHKVSPPQTITVEDFTASLKDISVQGVGELHLAASLLGTERSNLVLKGKVSRPPGALLPTGELEIEARSLDFDKLTALLAAYGNSNKDLRLSQQAALKFTVKSSPEGIQVDGNFNGTKAAIAYGELFQKAVDLPFTVETSGKVTVTGGADLPKVHLQIADIELDAPLTMQPLGQGTKVVLKTTGLPLGSLGKFLPPAQAYQLGGTLDSDCTITTAPGTGPVIDGTMQLKNVSARVPADPPVELNGVNAKLKSTAQGFTLEPAALPLFGGTVTVQGSLLNRDSVDAQVRGQKLDLHQLSSFAKSKVEVKGALDTMTLLVKGPLPDLKDRAAGTLSASASNGVIEGFNLLGETFGKLTTLPAIGPMVQSVIPEKYRPLLQANSTGFAKLNIEASFVGKNISLTSVNLQHELYIVDGQGKIQADGDMEVNAKLRFTPQLMKDLSTKEKKLAALLDKDQNVVIPIILRRSNGRFLVLPDVSDLAKRAVTNTAKAHVAHELDKVAPGLGGALNSLFK